MRACLDIGFDLPTVLPLVTSNTAAVLKLPGKGRVESGADADLLVLDRGSFTVVEVIAGGRRLVKDGRLTESEPWVANSRRRGHPGEG